MERRLTAVFGAAMCGALVMASACKKNDAGNADTTMSMMTHTDSTTTGMAPGATSGATTSTNAPAPTMTDAQIFARLSAANQGEIDAGKLASTKATNADVKTFAKMMVTDHSKMLHDGEALAKKLNVKPDQSAADSIKNANKSMADMLKSTPKGAAFDTAYVNGQVQGHEATLDMIKKAADQAQNADLKKMLNDAVPGVQKHLDRIKDIQGKMK